MATTAKLYSAEGSFIRDVELDERVWGQTASRALLHQAVVAYRANERTPNSHTKTRGEVRGGGKKPWRQKGTGRARAGSTRSPLWRGGGTTFGPLASRNFSQQLPRAMRRRALLGALHELATAGRVVLVESLPTDGKTKALAGLVSKLPVAGRKVLLVLPEPSAVTRRASQNIDGIELSTARSLNAYAVLRHYYLLAPLATLEALAPAKT